MDVQKECDKRMERLVAKHVKEIQEFNTFWDQQLAVLEKLNSTFSTSTRKYSIRVDNKFADKMKKYTDQKEMLFKGLEQKLLAELSEECFKAAHWLSNPNSFVSEDRGNGESSNLQSEPNLPCQGSDNTTNCQNELERVSFEKEQLSKSYEDLSLRLDSELAKELEEMMAKINNKYESNMQDAEQISLLKKKEIETMQNKVIRNKELSEAFRSTHLKLSFLTTRRMRQVMKFHFLELFSQLPPLQLVPSSSSIAATSSSDIPTTSQHDSVRPPPLQVSHQSELFSSTFRYKFSLP